MKNIDAIIFDLGGVILNLDYDKTIESFNKYLPNLGKENFLGRRDQLTFFNEYEVGQITTEEFIARFNEHFEISLSFDEFKTSWDAMILDFPPTRIELLKKLRIQGKKIYLLSNINDLHEKAVLDRYMKIGEPSEFFSLFDKTYYSHHINLRKPDREIFEHVIGEQKLDPKRTIFIDDSIQHVEGARIVGLNGIHLPKGNIVEEVFQEYFVTQRK